MSPLTSASQFLYDPTIDLGLSIYEVNEIWVGHGDAPIWCRLWIFAQNSTMLNWLIAAVVLYSGFVALLYMAQRSLQYFPERGRTAPWAVGLTEAEEVVLDSADGERVIVWHVPRRVERFRALTADGSGLVALSYRGYGGSSGRPTETGLTADAAAAYAFAIARYPAERIVLWGESLGSAPLYDGLTESIARCAFSAGIKTKVVRAAHGDSSGVRGAAWLWPINKP
jgi:fermentation-respiration switch protein FrsA (DUF1100 family)